MALLLELGYFFSRLYVCVFLIRFYEVEIAKLQKSLDSNSNEDDWSVKTAIELLHADYEVVQSQFEFSSQELSSSWVDNSNKLSSIEHEDVKNQEILKSWLIHFEQENLKLKRENDAIHLEISHIDTALYQTDTAMQEMRLLLESQLSQFSILKNQVSRSELLLKSYEKILAHAEKANVTSELENIKISPKPDPDENALTEELDGIKMLLECYKAQPTHVQEKVNAMCLEMQLKKQLEELKKSDISVDGDDFLLELQSCGKKVLRDLDYVQKSEEKSQNMIDNSKRQNGRLKRKEDSTTENIKLMEQTMKFQKLQKTYDEEKEKILEKIKILQNEVEQNNDTLTKSDSKEKMNYDHLRKHHDELEIRNASLDLSQRKVSCFIYL